MTRRKTSSTNVRDALRAMIRGGVVLSRIRLRELRMAFAKISDEDFDTLCDELAESAEPEQGIRMIRRDLRRYRGKASVFLPYLQRELEQRLGGSAVPKSAQGALKAMYAFASSRMTDATFKA